ncbi:type VI secretion protein IcmF/TssM N-terminal domain-containing protein [Dyella sp. C9]|uniref:type VI secretion protein IcmF/TssM N-terminal domain-containing protein n=1 Tax=Dyella sp. C9 TaxID=2202154 RepID=UPI0018E509CE|nr:type VI secretion protein IcmF/TssM N-terminal domain-containing protein [Dyella sp. C9]
MRLLECFAPLFSYGLLVDEQAAGLAAPMALPQVHEHARVLVEQARLLALSMGKPLTDVEMAGFAVVAWFDEIVARHESARGQSVRPLQLELFHTGSAATEFFDHLAGLALDADEVREVYAMALLLGFMGQYYYEQGDGGELGRIKALHCQACVTAGAVLQSLQREAITPQPYQVPGTPSHRLQAPWGGRRAAPLVAGLLVLLVLVAFVIPVFSSSVPAQAWYMAGVLIAVMGVLAWSSSVAWRELVLKRVHTRVAAHPDAGYGVGDVWAALADAARHVRGAMLHPFRRRGQWRRLSRHPWLLFVGDSATHVRGLLQAATQVPHARAMSGGDASKPWHWWMFRALVAIEPGASLVRAPDNPRDDESAWARALSILARERRKLPLDGVAICIGADHLLESPAAILAALARLHDLANETARRLQLQLPLYVVVTGLETLPGYAAFRAALPAATLRRAVGWRATGAHANASAPWRMDIHFSTIIERLRVAAMAALAMRHDARGRREVFAFLQSLDALQRGLQAFLGHLLAREVVVARRLHWCGVYLTARPHADAAGGDFVDDLFGRFLPADWLLARRVAPPVEERA